MVNFKIVEGVDTRNEAYEYMKQKAMNGEKFTNKEVREKYGISNSCIRRLRVELSEELGLKLYKGELKEIKHLYYSYIRGNGHFIIQKWIDGKMVSFGSCKEEETAKRIVAELKKVNWDKNKLGEIKRKVGV